MTPAPDDRSAPSRRSARLIDGTRRRHGCVFWDEAAYAIAMLAGRGAEGVGRSRPGPDCGSWIWEVRDAIVFNAVMDEEFLDIVLVAGHEPVVRVTIADPDPSWLERFEVERRHVLAALGERALAIEHIGSTSVPGLGAQPIIDLVVAVPDPEDDDRLVPALTAAGYELGVREPGHGIERVRGGLADAPHSRAGCAGPVHVCADSSPEIEAYPCSATTSARTPMTAPVRSFEA